jgi:hypothetical protein
MSSHCHVKVVTIVANKYNRNKESIGASLAVYLVANRPGISDSSITLVFGTAFVNAGRNGKEKQGLQTPGQVLSAK